MLYTDFIGHFIDDHVESKGPSSVPHHGGQRSELGSTGTIGAHVDSADSNNGHAVDIVWDLQGRPSTPTLATGSRLDPWRAEVDQKSATNNLAI